MAALFVLVGLFSAGMIALIGSVTWDQYQDTRKWQNDGWDIPLADVPAGFAKNYTDPGDLDAIRCWKDVETALAEIEAAGRVPDGKQEAYRELLDRAYAMQEKFPLVDGSLVECDDRLALYLDLEDVLAAAYENPDESVLEKMAERLHGWEREHPYPVQDVYQERLSQAAEDYRNLETFLAEWFPRLGTVRDGVLVIDPDMDMEQTNEVLAAIDGMGLRKFPLVDGLYERLDGHDWAVLLKHNEVVRSYAVWQRDKAVLENVGKDEYWHVAEITTYAKALEYGLAVSVTERPGYDVDPESPVLRITYGGERLWPDQYVKYGTPVLVGIDERYVEVPTEPEPSMEETVPLVTEPSSEESSETTGFADGTGPEERTEESGSDWEEDW